MSHWVNFKDLRARLRFVDVLSHYQIKLSVKENQHQGVCPLPAHKGSKDSRSFSVNLEKNIFHCFGCKAKGNVLEFAVYMDGGNPETAEDLRKVALQLQAWFFEAPLAKAKTTKPIEPLSPIVNGLLDFALQGLDTSHPAFKERKLSPKTIAYFGLGFCSRGLMKQRIAVPLHSEEKLVGYAGVVPHDEDASEVVHRILFPESRERQGKRLEFDSTLFLYNQNRLPKKIDDLIVVRDFPSVWWLHQSGYPNTVAIMNEAMSEHQHSLMKKIVTESGRIWILMDGEEGGQCASELILRLSVSRLVRWARLPDHTSPTDCTHHELIDLLWE